MMNRKERLTRLYFNKEVDRPAVYSRTGFPNNDPSYDKLKEYLQEYSELKLYWNASQIEESYPNKSFVEKYSDDFERHVTILHTPMGDLRKTYLASLKGQPGLPEEYFLKSRQDIKKYLSLPIPKIVRDVSSFKEQQAKITDAGIVDVGIGFNPAGFTVELLGSENFAIMSLIERDLIHQLCKRQTEIINNRVKFLINNDIGPFFSMLGEEYIVPPLHGPDDFRDFNVKYDKKIIDLIHERKGRIHIHCHGSIKKVFNDFIEMGADVLHPFEAPPSGDITTKVAKKLARGKLCLEGNIQIADMYEHTPAQIRQETYDLINDCFDDNKGLIVCPSASPYIRGQGEKCYPQYKAMIDTVLEFKK